PGGFRPAGDAMRRLTMADLYRMVQTCHANLLDREKWPDVAQMDTEYLDEIDRALHGASKAVEGFRGMVRREKERRGERVFVMPLRLVEDYDPMKNKVDL